MELASYRLCPILEKEELFGKWSGKPVNSTCKIVPQSLAEKAPSLREDVADDIGGNVRIKTSYPQ
jgi:hypothetical protein